ncbi:PIR protein [Plasmodium vivax]|uniref:VIR protein n=1 Tax=Plasmodium vivax TaxID=5855 RepID=A0A1G4GVW0_PLAVI|nr:PIR protein [Plasmodium vivax]SCO66697.1 VIR protein [Plasmodium vivax]
MGSDASEAPGEPKCNIVDDLKTCNGREKEVEEVEYPNDIASQCETIQNIEQGSKEEIKNICKQLMKYFLYWFKYKNDKNKTNKIDNYIEYFNYLLNDILRTNTISESERQKVYDDFKKIIDETKLSNLKDKIHHIDEEYYQKLKKMYELYEIFNKIKSMGDNGKDEKKECSNYISDCVKKYGEFKDICYVQDDKNKEEYKKLCSALRQFRVLYKNYKYNHKTCKDVNLPDLPEFEKPKVKTVKKKFEKFKECSTTVHNYSVDNIEEEYEKDILEQLDKYKFYKKFNIEEYSSEDNEYCSKIVPSIDNNCENYILCAKIETNFKKLHSMDSNKGNEELCLYFTYWLYDQISKMFSKKYNYIIDIPDIYKLFDVIHKINLTFEKKDKCYVEYRLNAKMSELKKMKHMHDYFMVFENLKTHLACKDENKQKCCDYVKHINELYKKYIGNCCTCYFRTKECHNNCDYFKCDQDYNPYELYKEFECEKLGDNEKGFEKVGTPTAIDYYFIHLRSLRPQCNSIFCDLFYVAVLSAFSILGLFLVFFIFYKFTPLGSRSQKRAINKKRIQNVIHEEEVRQRAPRGSNDRKKNPKPQRIRLAYQTAG